MLSNRFGDFGPLTICNSHSAIEFDISGSTSVQLVILVACIYIYVYVYSMFSLCFRRNFVYVDNV